MALLRRQKQCELQQQLNETPEIFRDWKKRSEAQWEKYHGIAGVDIYNHLNPENRFSGALRAKNHVIAGVDVFNHLNPNSTAREASKKDLFEAGYMSLLAADDNDAISCKKQRLQINDLTAQLQSFANTQ